jgi:hypothetical protein
MINSINTSVPHNDPHQSSSTSAAAQKAGPQQQTQASKSGALSHDQVTLKSTGSADRESSE